MSTLTILLNDGDDVVESVVDYNAAIINGAIKNVVGDVGSDEAIPVANVTKPIFDKVMEWCSHYASLDKEKEFEHDEEFDKQFLEQCLKTDNPNKTIDDDYLLELVQAANYLGNRPFLNLCARRVVECIRGKTIEEIRKENGISQTHRVAKKGDAPTVGPDGLMQIAFTEDEEKELMKIKPYEEWLKEVEEEEKK